MIWSPEETARRAIMGEATRAGITSESVGQWMNLAARSRYGRNPDPKGEAQCLRRALEIADIWGKRLNCYGMSEGTRAQALARLAEIEG